MERRRARSWLNLKRRRLADIDVSEARAVAKSTSSDLIVRRLSAFMSYATLEPRERAEIVVLTEELLERSRVAADNDLFLMSRAIAAKLHAAGATGPMEMNEIREDFWDLVCRYREHYG